MKSIKLIKEDFDILILKKDYNGKGEKYRKFANQYTNPMDCPIARALKRQGFSNPSIDPWNVSYIDGNVRVSKDIKGECKDLIRVSTELLNGAEFGEIEILK